MRYSGRLVVDWAQSLGGRSWGGTGVRSRRAFWIGIGGIIIGMVALGTEAMPMMGFDRGAQSAWFRVLFGLSVLTLLSAILLTAVGLARIVEEQPTRVQPVVDGYFLGRASRDAHHSAYHPDCTEEDRTELPPEVA